jgi:hypothetical protein
MALKPNGAMWAAREQIVEDPVSGLTFQFVLVPESEAPVRLRVFGNLPYGNREFTFDGDGNRTGAGTALDTPSRSSWLGEVLPYRSPSLQRGRRPYLARCSRRSSPSRVTG